MVIFRALREGLGHQGEAKPQQYEIAISCHEHLSFVLKGTQGIAGPTAQVDRRGRTTQRARKQPRLLFGSGCVAPKRQHWRGELPIGNHPTRFFLHALSQALITRDTSTEPLTLGYGRMLHPSRADR
jgi:hypothetical protein